MEEITQKLQSTYNNAALTSQDPKILAARAGVRHTDAKKFIASLGAAQVTTKYVAPDPKTYVPLCNKYGHWVADVIFFKDYASVNKKHGAIFTMINSNSRYVYCRPIIVDSLNGTARGVSSLKIANAMASILAENASDGAAPILSVTSDNGPENQGEYTKFMELKGIEHIKLEPRVHERMRRLDRFHKTLRLAIGNIFAMRNNHIWIDVLPDLVKNYNSRPHRSLSKFFGTATSPDQMTEKKDNEIMESDLKKVDWVRNQTRDLVGKSVRILMSRTNFGTKSEKTVKSNDQTWSSEIYEV